MKDILHYTRLKTSEMLEWGRMKKRWVLILSFLGLLAGCSLGAGGKAALAPSVLKPVLVELEGFKKDERVLILAPHPDDETIGCAGVIQQALRAGAKVKVLYLTNGDHNELSFIVYEKRITVRYGEFIHMGMVRQKEAVKAMQLLGLAEKNLIFLGYPDYGTFNIFTRYWQSKKPFRDRLTRISKVPYKDSPSYRAPYQGESILHDIEKTLLDYKPHKIFVSHPADVNVDHKAFYLYLQVALSDLKSRIPDAKLYPYLVHCVGWPLPRHYHPELELYPPGKFWESQIDWKRLTLGNIDLENKYKAILCYRSQTQTSAFYLLAFARKNELFGDYPEHESVDEAAREKEGVSYSVSDDSLLIRLGKSEKISRRFGVLVYIFGYSGKTAFAQMPKVRIITSGKNFKVFLGRQRLAAADISLKLEEKALSIKIPLKFLGDPDYILAAFKSYNGTIPIDAAGFRKVLLSKPTEEHKN